MYSKTYQITGSNLQQPLEEFVRMHHQQAHESVYPGGFIRLYEDYSFLNGNDIMICVRVDSTAAVSNKISIEFIAGGSREGLLTVADLWGSEKRRVSKFNNDLLDFCAAHRFEVFEEEGPE